MLGVLRSFRGMAPMYLERGYARHWARFKVTRRPRVDVLLHLRVRHQLVERSTATERSEMGKTQVWPAPQRHTPLHALGN
jgi:hypothetical protein